jgi:hypothetical protein
MTRADLRELRSRVTAHLRAILSERDQFGYVLVLIALTLVLRAWAGDTKIGLFLSVALGGLTLAFILHTCGVHRRLLISVEILIVFAIVLSGLGIILGSQNDGHQMAGLFGLSIAFLAPFAIVRRVARAPVITFRVVLGALSIYLLFGLAYSYLYGFVQWFQGEPFFNQTADPSSAIYIYFSYITMATVGYGDFTPATDLGRMLAVSQALLGQLYLVSVVAVIVGNIGRTRRAIKEDAVGGLDADAASPDASPEDRPDPGADGQDAGADGSVAHGRA